MVLNTILHYHRVVAWRCISTSVTNNWSASLLVGDIKWKDINSDKVCSEDSHDLRAAKKIMRPLSRRIVLPDRLQAIFDLVFEKYDMKTLANDAQSLSNKLWSKIQRPTNASIMQNSKQMRQKLLEAHPVPAKMDAAEKDLYMQDIEHLVMRNVRRSVFHWTVEEYNEYRAAQYLYARFAAEFSSLVSIFREIRHRDPEYVPRTLLDVGSGVGSVMWAADHTWHGALREHICVDKCKDMNSMAQWLIESGVEGSEPCFNVYFRPHLPGTSKAIVNLATSAYTLLELPSLRQRCETIESMWTNVKDGGYLIVVENGTNAGYQCVMEARQFLIDNFDSTMAGGDDGKAGSGSFGHGQIIAPCPHQDICGRYIDGSNTPCNFPVHYKPYVADAVPNRGRMKDTKKWLYSYVVAKKGGSPDSDKCKFPDNSWPRVVRETRKRSKHVFCHLCLPDGGVRQFVATKGGTERGVYRVVRGAEWGQRVPVNVRGLPPDSNNTNCND